MAVGIPGNIVIQSTLTAPDGLATIAASSMLLAIGAVCWLATVAGDAAHGVLMFPVLKRHSERSAVGYLAARIMDATFIAVMVLLVLIQIPIGAAYLDAGTADTSYLQALSTVLAEGNLYAYEIAMTTLGVSGLILCSAFFRSNLIPRPLAVWGLGRLRGHPVRIGAADPRVQPELDPGHPGRPVGGVHRCVADRQGIRHPGRSARTDVDDHTCHHRSAAGQRNDMINRTPMTGRTVLGTGATSGIGLSTALGLARMGDQIAIASRDSRRNEAAARR